LFKHRFKTRIDYCFLSSNLIPHIEAVNYKVLDSEASDHRPVQISLRIRTISPLNDLKERYALVDKIKDPRKSEEVEKESKIDKFF